MKKKYIVTICCPVILILLVGIFQVTYGYNIGNDLSDVPEAPGHHTSYSNVSVAPAEPGTCRCRLDALKIIAAATEDPLPAAGQAEEPAGTPLAERVRRAGELLVNGDAARAREIIMDAIRDCENKGSDVRDCAQWMEAMRGLNSLMAKPSERIVYTNSEGMKMVRIPAGEYMMGSLKQELDWLRLTFKKIWRDGHKQWFQDELPLHPVRITRPFYISATEVRVGQFREFIKDTRYKTDAEKGDGGMIWSNKEERWAPQKDMKWDAVPWRSADDHPVVFVSWNDAKEFCRWLSKKEKRSYRLPTEAEWEMACRGGAVWARYPWGNRLPGDRDTNFGDGNPKLPESLTTVDDGYQYVAPVGSYPPNGFGLYDMSGNVMEWVEDYYERNYYDGSPLEDPKGPASGTSHVNKGGNWYSSPADDRCAFRGFSGPEMSFWNLGFRVVMEEKDEDRPISVAARPRTDEGEEASAPDDPAFPPSESDGMRLFRQAMFAAQQQQWDNAVKDLEEALKIYEKREDHLWAARVRATIAGVYAEQNRTYKAKELFTQSLAEFRKIGDGASAKIILQRLQDLETSPGVKVVEVKKGGIAANAGVVPGDVIIEYGGETGFRVSGFKKLVEDYSRAAQVTLTVMNNNEITTTVVAGGALGVAVEDIKRPPRPARPQQQRDGQSRPRERRQRR